MALAPCPFAECCIHNMTMGQLNNPVSQPFDRHLARLSLLSGLFADPPSFEFGCCDESWFDELYRRIPWFRR